MALDMATSRPDDTPRAADEGTGGPVPPRSGSAVVARWLPLALAIVCFAVLAGLVLSQAEKLIEPDPYAYRASIAALEDGNLTLTQDQHDQLTAELQKSSLGGGILQWHQTADGSWVSEKNPGYPFLAVGFDEAGALRLAPLFYGALACIGLWFGGRRWLGRWGGTFAVGAYCSAAVVMVMAWRSTMPTFTDASLVACGVGLLVWAALALERTRRIRVVVGSLAFLALGLAVFVRYTNVAVLAVAAGFALALCLRPRWRLGRTTLVWWALVSSAPLIASLAYNAVVFDGPFSTGYRSSDVQFTLESIPKNLKIMPSHLWRAMPVFVIALAAVVAIVGIQLWSLTRRRSDTRPTMAPSTESLTAAEPAEVPRLVADRWIGLFLVGAWAATWGVYAAYQWTANVGGGGFGGPGGGGGIGGTTYTIVRFYVPAMGAIALLASWLLVRLPKAVGVAVIVVLFVVGVAGFLSTVNSRWAQMFGGGGITAGAGQGFPGGGQGAPSGQGGPGGQVPDLSKCPNLPSLPTGPTGGQPGSGTGGPQFAGGTPGGGPPTGLTFDADGCPVFPSTTTTAPG